MIIRSTRLSVDEIVSFRQPERSVSDELTEFLKLRKIFEEPKYRKSRVIK